MHSEKKAKSLSHLSLEPKWLEPKWLRQLKFPGVDGCARQRNLSSPEFFNLHVRCPVFYLATICIFISRLHCQDPIFLHLQQVICSLWLLPFLIDTSFELNFPMSDLPTVLSRRKTCLRSDPRQTLCGPPPPTLVAAVDFF